MHSQTIKDCFIEIIFNLAEIKFNACHDEKFHYSN